MFEIEELHHVSLAVTNLEKAKHFYEHLLGFKELERPNFDFPGAWYEVGQQQLHLIVEPSASTIRRNHQINSREGHFAIRVKDYDKTLEYLENSGIEIEVNRNSKSGFAQIFCMDPDHNLIEFNVDQSSLK